MTDHDNSGGEAVIPAGDSDDYEVVGPIEDLIALERSRVESQNFRLQIASQAIEANALADQRQYNYHSKKLEQDAEARNKNRALAARFLWAVFGVLAMFGSIFLYMLFFGTEIQRTTAIAILRVLATALGGGGGLLFIGYLFNRLKKMIVGD